MAEKALFPQDSRLYLGTTSNPLLVERSVLLSVYSVSYTHLTLPTSDLV